MAKIIIKPEVQKKVDELINQRKRKYFGSSGASLTHELKGDKQTDFKRKALETGLRGENRTTLMLKDWIKTKNNVILVDSVHLKQRGVEKLDGKDTDHVLIMGNTILLLDTKVWKRKRKYKISKTGTILRGNRNFPGGKVNSKAAMYMWRNYFPEAKNIFACICIQQKEVFVPYDTEWKKSPFKVVTAENLFTYLDYIYKKNVKPNEPINTKIAAKVIVSAVKPKDPLSEIFTRTTI